MNRILLNKLWLVLTGVLLSLTSCSQATSLGEEPALKTDDARTVTLTLRAGAEVYAGTHPALEREKQINSLTAYLFSPQGDYVETVSAVAVSGATGEYKVKSTQAGSYQMVLVANLPVVTDLTGKVISDLDQHLVTEIAGNATHNNFVMRNLGASISIQTYEDAGSDYRGTPILMERLSARFDINLLATGYQIKSVQLKNGATQSQLYNNNGEGKQLQTGTAATVNASEYIAHLYSYENSSATNHTSLEIICSYGGVELKPIEVTFPTVKRNHLYMVKITEKPSDNFKPNDPKDRSDLLNVNVEVLDWFAGTVLSVKKAEIDKLVSDYSHPKYNPLSYMAHYNVTRDKKWNTAHTISTSRYDQTYRINWDDAMSLFKNAQSIENSSEQYRLPTDLEWVSIIPYNDNAVTFFGRDGISSPNVTDQVTLGGKTFWHTSDYQPRTYTITGVNNGNSVDCNVALRFRGGTPEEQPYRSAWLYYYGPNADGKNGLHIYCVNVAGDNSITSVNSLDQSWWSQYISDAVYRFLPATGEYIQYPGFFYGYYWSSWVEDSSGELFSISFDEEDASAFVASPKAASDDMSVRLFSLTPLD